MALISSAVLAPAQRLPIPVLSFPGAPLAGVSVHTMATDAVQQFNVQVALHRRFGTPVVMTAMDLSLEAEEFGSRVQFADDEIPTVAARLVENLDAVADLAVPVVGGKRTAVPLETARRLAGLPDRPPVLGCMIGPLSLAGRLLGVSEALLATSTDPEEILLLIEKATLFLVQYARAFKQAGAHGLIIAEPTAGLLSPRALGIFSSPSVKRILEAVQDSTFDVILHNCGARIAHLDAILESGARLLHFGKPMDVTEALRKVPPSTIIGGNLDPAEVFHNGTPQEVAVRTQALLTAAAAHRNFFPSSGCDIPPCTSLDNIAAFFEAVAASPHA